MLFVQDLKFYEDLERLFFWKEASTCDWDTKPQNVSPEDAKTIKAEVNAGL